MVRTQGFISSLLLLFLVSRRSFPPPTVQTAVGRRAAGEGDGAWVGLASPR